MRASLSAKGLKQTRDIMRLNQTLGELNDATTGGNDPTSLGDAGNGYLEVWLINADGKRFAASPVGEVTPS